MNEREKPPLPSQGSQLAPESQSRDALDSASVRRLTDALNRNTDAVNDAREHARQALANADHREGMMRNALKAHAEKFEELRSSNDRQTKLFKEVAGARGKVLEQSAAQVKQAAADLRKTGEHLVPQILAKLPHEKEEEITAEHLKVRWSTLAKYAPWIVKGAVVVAGIGAAIWAAIKGFAHKF